MLDRDPRTTEGTESIARPPEVGDEGTLIDYGSRDGRSTYVVEMVNEGGGTVWLAEFFLDEIEMIDDPDGADPAASRRPRERGDLVSMVSLLVANGVAMFLCLLLVEEVSPWVVFIGATIGAILGNLTARRFLDGMMFTMIAAIVTWLAFLFLPLPLLLRQIWLSFGGGICTAKMLVGGYREFRD